jgi:hypothetical protein
MNTKKMESNPPVIFNWKRNHLFDKFLVEILYNNCKTEFPYGKVKGIVVNKT